MAATETLRQFPESLQPRHGVITLYGYGISVRVDRGHLILHDGIGAAQREGRFARVGHGIRRLVVIGNDGMVSLAALRWLADQDAAFVMLERDGSVLATTGPVRPSDARLRRAQGLARETGVDVKIARYLIDHKLLGQEQVVRDQLLDDATGDNIAGFRKSIGALDNLAAIRLAESRAAALYWAAWQDLPVCFPKNDLPRVPGHWLTFGTRTSVLTASPRLAVNPPNAMLNYLYTVLMSECRLAAAALGLDPGLGFLHADTPARDSLACDLMEVVRPKVDRLVLDWLQRGLLRRQWFFEEQNGNCRLMSSFATQLSETATTRERAVAPFAEWVARTLWTRVRKPDRETAPPTRLTQQSRRESQGSELRPAVAPKPRLQRLCRDCGKTIAEGAVICQSCMASARPDHMREVARLGRAVTLGREAQARRRATQHQHRSALRDWNPTSLPEWLSKEMYVSKIQPALRAIPLKDIMSLLNVSIAYASAIRKARRVPHPRHWLSLAELARVSRAGPN